MAKAEHAPSIITMIIEFLVVPSGDLWGIELFSWDIPSTSKKWKFVFYLFANELLPKILI